MPWIDTSLLDQDAIDALNPHDAHQIYNGLDATCTFEVFDVLSEELRQLNHAGPKMSYDFKRAMQGPALTMMERGIKIDIPRRADLLDTLHKKREFLEGRLNQLSIVISGGPCNPRSGDQVKALFYDAMGIPRISVRKKGEVKEPMDMEILEKIRDEYIYARPIASLIIAIRELSKSIGFTRTPLGPDGRLHCSYNVAATETDRWSSSECVFGYGTNLQNVAPELRSIAIADHGYILIHPDLSQAESFVVGLAIYRACGDTTYLEACESGDLHTFVAQMCWPDLGWTNDYVENRRIADRIYYRNFSYRDISKRLGHATNYRGSAWQIARVLHIEQDLVEDFQWRYKSAFHIEDWHIQVAESLQVDNAIDTLLGTRRHFFGRPGDDHTLKEAIAHEPQHTVAKVLNLGLYRVWRDMDSKELQLLLQEHDAFTAQCREKDLERVILKVQERMKVELTTFHKDVPRKTTIPGEIKVGWNWGEFDPAKNIDGLKKWNGSESRTRQGNPNGTLLDKQIRGVHRGVTNS